jgi:hypothetical protein
MKKGRRLLAVAASCLSLAACVDHVGKPLLLPVGTPAQFREVVHITCVGEADVAYDRQKEEFARRARMSAYGFAATDTAAAESQAEAAARMKYQSCAASQGYRAVYR